MESAIFRGESRRPTVDSQAESPDKEQMTNILVLSASSAPAARDVLREEPLRVLSGGARGASMSAWRGRSGRRYVVDIETELAMGADLVEAVVVAVVREGSGRRRPLGAAAPEAGEPPAVRLRWLSLMATKGANELHVHHLADTPDARREVVADLDPGP